MLQIFLACGRFYYQDLNKLLYYRDVTVLALR
jgi:hypothetical protein